MVYGVISGYGIEIGGCEGDVRVFIDDIASPTVESDGSESWGSYGWGFVTPPQCNPFSAYNGAYDKNSDWSEQRLTFTDSYVFRSHLRFELEHGDINNGGGAHSGQVFMYMKKEPAEELLLEITPDSPQYKTDGVIETVRNRFENGIHENYVTFKCASNVHLTEFYVDIPYDVSGLAIKRVSLQNQGRKEAEVYVDDIKIAERNWLYADYNDIYSFLEDEYIVPSKYLAGKSRIKLSIKPLDEKHTECRYRIFAIK